MDPAANDPLQALGRVTSEIDAANPSPEQIEQAERDQAKMDEAERSVREWAALAYSIGGIITMALPELRQVYSEEACMAWGTHADAVGRKYGWNAPSAPEIGLAVATIGFAAPTALAIHARLQLVRENKDAGFFGKVVLWWRHRQAVKRQAAAIAKNGEGEQGGGQQ